MSSQVSEICTHKKWKQWREQDELHCSFFLMLPQLPREKGRWNWIAEHILANKATEQKSRAAAAGTRPHQNITTLANNGKKEVREHKSGVKTSKVGRGWCVMGLVLSSSFRQRLWTKQNKVFQSSVIFSFLDGLDLNKCFKRDLPGSLGSCIRFFCPVLPPSLSEPWLPSRVSPASQWLLCI